MQVLVFAGAARRLQAAIVVFLMPGLIYGGCGFPHSHMVANKMDRAADDAVVLGIDAGGTHTDAVLCAGGKILGCGKVATEQDNLPHCIANVLDELVRDCGQDALGKVQRVTLGTTLLVNACVQDKLDKVGLVLSAGPGLNPMRFAMGNYVCVVPGGLDHRGVEVTPLQLQKLAGELAKWKKAGVGALACAGKFSPRNPAHELAMAEECARVFPQDAMTLGHRLGGELNFPRRIASAYYNSASLRLHNAFLDAVLDTLQHKGCTAPVFLLRADGGSMPCAASRLFPVHSLLSGPAASVMGVMALQKGLEDQCTLLLDMGGTTTDLAVFVDGSPVMDQDGMKLGGRRTLVRSLATVSIGIGGDSVLRAVNGSVQVGPDRMGPAAAFGGKMATLLDALNILNSEGGGDETAGSLEQSRQSLQSLADELGKSLPEASAMAWEAAAEAIGSAIKSLVADINERPIYTLRELKAHEDARPCRVALTGGPALCVRHHLERALSLPVCPVPQADVANAAGAALTRPSARLEVYAGTEKGTLLAPAFDITEKLPRNASLEYVKDRSLALLKEKLAQEGIGDLPLQITSADLFATLTDSGYGSRDMRVVCQTVPGLAARLYQD